MTRKSAQPIGGINTDAKLRQAVGLADPALFPDKQPNELDSGIDLLNVAETARFLNISASGVRRLQQGRHIPFYKVGGSVRFAKDDLLAYLMRHRVGSIGK
jgi:excisionase family DNA binding protein